MSSAVRIGIIGGSGLYDMAELTEREERVVSTPFGEPSAPLVIATLGPGDVAGEVAMVLRRNGGDGAVRELAEHLLKQHGHWQTLNREGWRDLNS